MSNGNGQNGSVGISDMPVAIFTPHIHGKSENTQVRQIGEKAEQEAGAKAGTVKARVTRIPDMYAGPIGTVEGQIRNLFYKHGIRIGDSFAVPIAILPAFKKELDAKVLEYNLYFSKMIEAVESGEMETILRNEAGENIKLVKIPTVKEIREGYGVEINMNVNFNSAKVNEALKVLTDDMKEQLKVEVEASVKRENEMQLSASGKKIVAEVKEFLADINKRCGATDAKGLQFKTMIDRLDRITKVLPAYNVTGDKTLSDLLETVRTKFDGLNKETLKADKAVRDGAVAKAQEIAAGFANVF